MSKQIFVCCAIKMAFSIALIGAVAGVGAQPVAQPGKPKPVATEPVAMPPVQAPYPSRPGSGGPGQGEISAVPSDGLSASAGSAAQVLAADLALIRGFKVGDVNIPWGDGAVVSAEAASSRNAGKCVFQYRYSTRNQGHTAAASVTNRIFLDARNGTLLASALLPALAKNAQAASIGEFALRPGGSLLYVHADAVNQVAEIDEANNLRRVRVTVHGDCSSP